MKKIILLSGPTASGKSKLALNLAKKIKGEIINADSMQVYKEFKILSSRPSKTDTNRIKHHLYGFLSVKNHFSAGEWLLLTKKKISSILKKNKIPIIVGGTGLYFNAVTKGISKIPQIDKELRKKIRDLHNKLGQKRFYAKLLKKDPNSKNHISPTDPQRSMRAYEVKIFTKKSLFEWASNTRSDFLDFDMRKIYLDFPKEELLKNISKRTDFMFKKKCINEVKNFRKYKIDKSLSANKIIGVREISDYLDSRITLDEAQNLIKIRTRQYAKRQNTWSRGHMTTWKKLYSKDFSVLLKKVLKEIT